MSKPLIAVTMGDSSGVGPEVRLQLLANTSVHEFVTPMIFADRTRAKRACTFQHSEEVRASFVAVYCGYHEVPGQRTKERSRGTKPKIPALGLKIIGKKSLFASFPQLAGTSSHFCGGMRQSSLL